MGFGEPVRSLNPVASPGELSLKYPKPRSDERTPRSSCSTEVYTPEEALSFINRLHKSGRMEDLATLLRRNKVFREAWLILQRSSPTDSETFKRVNISTCQIETAEPGNFPILPNQELNPEQELKKSGVAVEPEFTSATVMQSRANASLNSAFKPTHTLTAALQIYESQLSYYAQGKDPTVRISIRV